MLNRPAPRRAGNELQTSDGEPAQGPLIDRREGRGEKLDAQERPDGAPRFKKA